MSTDSLQSVSGAAAARTLVLMYHRIGEAVNAWEQRYCVEPRRFAAHMRALHDCGFRPCSIESYFAWITGRASLPARSFLLTFDDGFMGVFEHARPVLLELGWTATVFVVSARIGGDDAWDEAHNPARRRHSLVGRTEIERMASEGFSMQSHSRHHSDLTAIPRAQLRDELEGSRGDLQALLGSPVHFLAYPFGRFDAEVKQAALDAGFLGALSTKPGFNRPGTDAMAVLRLDVAGTDNAGSLLRKMQFGCNDGSLAATARYVVGRVAARAGLGGA
jgi:peptidoglycan/xylan/chitin deacetylase (PgdA/CDA1 family)